MTKLAVVVLAVVPPEEWGVPSEAVLAVERPVAEALEVSVKARSAASAAPKER